MLMQVERYALGQSHVHIVSQKSVFAKLEVLDTPAERDMLGLCDRRGTNQLCRLQGRNRVV